MQKIKTLFKLEKTTTGKKPKILAINKLIEGSEWVLDKYEQQYVTPYIKLNGTPAMYDNGILYKRATAKNSEEVKKFINYGCLLCPREHGENYYLWKPIKLNNINSEDTWFLEGLKNELEETKGKLINGTYELVGPKINKNQHDFPRHRLINHKTFIINRHEPCLTFTSNTLESTYDIFKEVIRRLYCVVNEEFIKYQDQNKKYYLKFPEGIVFHHKDGRMVKMRYKDFY